MPKLKTERFRHRAVAAARQGCDVTSIARLLALLVTIAGLAGCAPSPRAQIDALQPPQTLLQLIEAMWRVNQSGLILRSEFYTVDTLKRAFGGTDIDLQVGRSDVLIGSYWGEVRGFSWTPPQAEPLRFRRLTIHPTGDLDASLSLMCGCPQVRRADIERLFGRNWKQEPRMIMRHGLSEQLPMSPDANMGMVYSYGDRQSGWEASFAFRSDGALDTIGIGSHRLK